MHNALKLFLQRSTLHRRVRKRPEGRRSSSKIGSVSVAYNLRHFFFKHLLYTSDINEKSHPAMSSVFMVLGFWQLLSDQSISYNSAFSLEQNWKHWGLFPTRVGKTRPGPGPDHSLRTRYPTWHRCSLFVPPLPPPTLFNLPYQQQTMGAAILADQDIWVFIFSIAMNDYVSNFQQSKNFCVEIYQPLYFKLTSHSTLLMKT